MSIIDNLIMDFFARLSPAGPGDILDEIPRVYHNGKMITEAEYNLIMEKETEKREEENAKKRIIEREKHIAAIKRRFNNHEDILSVINNLSDEHQDDVLEFLVSLRKTHRDEFNWEMFKNELIAKEDVYLKTKLRLLRKAMDAEKQNQVKVGD